MAGNDVRDAASRIFGLLSNEEQRKRRLAVMMDRLQRNGWVDRRPPRAVQGPTVADAANAFGARLAAKDSLRAEAERQIAGQTGLDSGAIQIADEKGRDDLTGHGDDDSPIETPEDYPLPPRKPALDPLAHWPGTQSPLASAVIRAETIPDGIFGYGTYGASRAGGKRPPHKGIDLATAAGTPVYAPIKGTISAIGEAYEKDNKGLATIHVRSDDGHLIKIFYVAPIDGLSMGQVVDSGTLLGISQSLQEKHPPESGSKMTDHVHFEFYDPKGRRVDPTPWVGKWRKEVDNWWRMGGRKDVFDSE